MTIEQVTESLSEQGFQPINYRARAFDWQSMGRPLGPLNGGSPFNLDRAIGELPTCDPEILADYPLVRGPNGQTFGLPLLKRYAHSLTYSEAVELADDTAEAMRQAYDRLSGEGTSEYENIDVKILSDESLVLSLGNGAFLQQGGSSNLELGVFEYNLTRDVGTPNGPVLFAGLGYIANRAINPVEAT